jgi:hypothetical protein
MAFISREYFSPPHPRSSVGIALKGQADATSIGLLL